MHPNNFKKSNNTIMIKYNLLNSSKPIISDDRHNEKKRERQLVDDKFLVYTVPINDVIGALSIDNESNEYKMKTSDPKMFKVGIERTLIWVLNYSIIAIISKLVRKSGETSILPIVLSAGVLTFAYSILEYSNGRAILIPFLTFILISLLINEKNL